jgi:hypothetical protein
MDTILVESDGPVATLTLNNPAARNAFGVAMRGEIAQAERSGRELLAQGIEVAEAGLRGDRRDGVFLSGILAPVGHGRHERDREYGLGIRGVHRFTPRLEEPRGWDSAE